MSLVVCLCVCVVKLFFCVLCAVCCLFIVDVRIVSVFVFGVSVCLYVLLCCLLCVACFGCLCVLGYVCACVVVSF